MPQPLVEFLQVMIPVVWILIGFIFYMGYFDKKSPESHRLDEVLMIWFWPLTLIGRVVGNVAIYAWLLVRNTWQHWFGKGTV